MEQAGREDWMLRKGIEDERKAIGGVKGKIGELVLHSLALSPTTISLFLFFPP